MNFVTLTVSTGPQPGTKVASITMGECRRGGKAAECVGWGVKFPRFLWLFMVLSSLDKERAFSLLAPLIPDLGSLFIFWKGAEIWLNPLPLTAISILWFAQPCFSSRITDLVWNGFHMTDLIPKLDQANSSHTYLLFMFLKWLCQLDLRYQK